MRVRGLSDKPAAVNMENNCVIWRPGYGVMEEPGPDIGFIVKIGLRNRHLDPEVASLRHSDRVGPQVSDWDLDLDILFDMDCVVVECSDDGVLPERVEGLGREDVHLPGDIHHLPRQPLLVKQTAQVREKRGEGLQLQLVMIAVENHEVVKHPREVAAVPTQMECLVTGLNILKKLKFYFFLLLSKFYFSVIFYFSTI